MVETFFEEYRSCPFSKVLQYFDPRLFLLWEVLQVHENWDIRILVEKLLLPVLCWSIFSWDFTGFLKQWSATCIFSLIPFSSVEFNHMTYSTTCLQRIGNLSLILLELCFQWLFSKINTISKHSLYLVHFDNF